MIVHQKYVSRYVSRPYCSVTRVTHLASQTQLSIVFHRKVLVCWFSMLLSGIVIVVLAGENAFSFHHEILLWINLVTLMMKTYVSFVVGSKPMEQGSKDQNT